MKAWITALLCLALAFSCAAEAKTPRAAKFKVTVSGSDDVIWSFQRKCGQPQATTYTGSDHITYRTTKPVKVTARYRSDHVTKLAPGPLDGVRIPVSARVTRQTDFHGCGASDPDNPPATPDCGTKTFSDKANLRYLSKDTLAFFTMGSAVHFDLFHHCPGADGEGHFGVFVGNRDFHVKYSQKKLLAGKKKKFSIKRKGSETFTEAGNTTYKTNWKATFRRVR